MPTRGQPPNLEFIKEDCRFGSISWVDDRSELLLSKPSGQEHRSALLNEDLWRLVAICNGRHLIDRILDWPNPHGFTKGVRFVCLNRYVQIDRKPFGQSEIQSIRVLHLQQWQCAKVEGKNLPNSKKIISKVTKFCPICSPQLWYSS